MCKKESLATTLFATNLLLLLAGLVVFVMGVVIAVDQRIVRAYGTAISTKGVVIALVGALSMVTSWCGVYGARSHNKFCLVSYTAFMGAWSLVAQMMSAGIISDDLRIPTLEEEEAMRACLTNEDGSGVTNVTSECAAYLSDPFTSTLRDVWWEMHELSLAGREESADEDFVVKTIQDAGSCCGFEPPRTCALGPHGLSHDYRAAAPYAIPAGPPPYALPEFCGHDPGFFAARDGCDRRINDNFGKFVRFAGCDFFLPLGDCATDLRYEQGCALELQLWLNARVQPLAEWVQLITVVNALCAAVSCAFCAKRKNDDVLPTEFVSRQAAKYAKAASRRTGSGFESES